jgi:hypothetical protein
MKPPDDVTVTVAKLGVAAHDFTEDHRRPQAWCRRQHRHNLGIEDPGQWIGPPPVTRGALVRGQPRIIHQPQKKDRVVKRCRACVVKGSVPRFQCPRQND